MKEFLDRLYGEPVMKLNLQQFAEGEGGDGTADSGADNGGTGDNGAGGNNGGTNPGEGGDMKSLMAQIEQMKADMAKQKTALDAATSQAADYKKQLRTKQTQEEIDAANKKEADEKAAQELAELRKEVARAKSTKSVMSKLSLDEESAGKIAECLVGCENIDNALLLIQQAWTAKEKALRLEFGKIPGPGAGGAGDEDSEEKAAIERAKKLGRERGNANKSVAEGLKGYIR